MNLVEMLVIIGTVFVVFASIKLLYSAIKLNRTVKTMDRIRHTLKCDNAKNITREGTHTVDSSVSD